MIVKNEEKYLRDCLISVRDIVDEIVLVDTGSSDNTISIAKEFNARIFYYKWIEDFSDARNFALSKSTGDWILYLDADERLSANSINKLKNIIGKKELSGYRCIINSIDEINGKPNLMRYTRLFYNKPKIKFSGRVHEQIDDSLMENGYKILNSDIEIIHIGYNVVNGELRNKAGRNLKILKKEYEKNKSSYNAYQLANTYTALEEYDIANQFYKISVKENNLNKEYMAFSYLNLSGYEYKKNNLNKAVEYLKLGLINDSSNPLLNLLASEISFRMNKINESYKYCRTALHENKKILSGISKCSLSIGLKNETIISKGIYFSVLSSNKIEVNYFLNELNKENKKLSEIVRKLIDNEKISDLEKNSIPELISNNNLDVFLILFERHDNKILSVEVLKKVYSLFKNNSKFLKTLGLLYLENNFLNEAEKMFEESLSLKEKDPSSVFLLISVYLEENKYQKIPSLLIMAEKEFADFPEFNSRFEILKQKLSTIFNN